MPRTRQVGAATRQVGAANVEIKARLADAAAVEVRAAALADHGPTVIAQDDTFFRTDAGRLKLRAFADGTGELIYYRRPDATGPTVSSYVRAPTSDPDATREALAGAYGVAGRVTKTRRLYLVGRTRVHLDAVDGLGDFLELEVVLAHDEPAAAGEREAHALLDALGVPASALVATAYVDLLADRRAGA